MRIYTRESLARTAAKKWKNSYFDSMNELWYFDPNFDKENIYNQLIELGDLPNPDDVDEVIGDDGWTRIKCMECNSDDGECWVRFDGGYLCDKCITRMTELLLSEGMEFENEPS